MNKVTKESIDKKIKSVSYNRLTDKITHCVITLENGFQVTGESACVDPANYDQMIGEKIAYENAYNELWPLEGYLLQEKLHLKKKYEERNPLFWIHPEAAFQYVVLQEEENEEWIRILMGYEKSKEKPIPPGKGIVETIKEYYKHGLFKTEEKETVIPNPRPMGSAKFHKEYPLTPDQAFKSNGVKEKVFSAGTSQERVVKTDGLKEKPSMSDVVDEVYLNAKEANCDMIVYTKNGKYRMDLQNSKEHRKLLQDILRPYLQFFEKDQVKKIFEDAIKKSQITNVFTEEAGPFSKVSNAFDNDAIEKRLVEIAGVPLKYFGNTDKYGDKYIIGYDPYSNKENPHIINKEPFGKSKGSDSDIDKPLEKDMEKFKDMVSDEYYTRLNKSFQESLDEQLQLLKGSRRQSVFRANAIGRLQSAIKFLHDDSIDLEVNKKP